MAANKESLEPKYIQAVTLKAEGKSFDEIAKIMGTTKNTAWRWYYKGIEQDGTISDIIDDLKYKCLDIAIEGKKVGVAFIEQVLEKKKSGEPLTPEEARVVDSIVEKNHKGYASLQGAMTDDKGGEKIVSNSIAFINAK